MKKIWKKLMMVVLAVVLLSPMVVMAEEQTKANPTSIQEACKEEGITFDHSDYKNNQEDKVNIYLFRGQGCSHCYEFLEYLESIIDDYGKYFNVVTFEVWNDTTNNDLMEKVAAKFEEEASGVPYIVIGEKTFSGYSSSMNEELQSLIKEEYEKEDRYDVMKELNVDTTVRNVKVTPEKTNASDIIIVVVAILIVGGIAALAITARKQN